MGDIAQEAPHGRDGGHLPVWVGPWRFARHYHPIVAAHVTSVVLICRGCNGVSFVRAAALRQQSPRDSLPRNRDLIRHRE